MNFDVRFELSEEFTDDPYGDADELADELGDEWTVVRKPHGGQYLAKVTEDDE